MIKILKNWAKMTFGERLVRGKRILDQCESNPDVPVLSPAYGNLKAAHDEFKEAHAEVLDLEGKLKAARCRRSTAADCWGQLNGNYGSYVEGCAGDSGAIVLGAGFELAEQPGPRPAAEMSQVFGLILSTSEYEGQINAEWAPVPAARVYEVQTGCHPDDSSQWQRYGTWPTRTSLALAGFPSGQRLWVRVRAVGADRHPPGPWSDPAKGTVP